MKVLACSAAALRHAQMRRWYTVLALASGVSGVDAAFAGTELGLSAPLTLHAQGARNPTVAVDAKSGTVYAAWAQEQAKSSGSAKKLKSIADVHLQVMLARSDDGGAHFGSAVVVNAPADHVMSYTVSPTRVAVGNGGQVYVLYESSDPRFKTGGWKFGQAKLRLVQSQDGGRSFSKPVDVGSQAQEGVFSTVEMLNLFVAPNNDLYVSFLDYREELAYYRKFKHEPKREEAPPVQLRVAKSTDGGKHFGASTLVAKPTCGCCGTQVTQAAGGPLYATTRAAWKALKGSYDEVRDLFVATSRDGGTSWSAPVKIHDDQFKISACPDVTPGLAVDSKGRLHAAWYTGTEKHPGVFYARSDDEAKTFSTPIKLLGDEWVPYADVKLALDAEANAWVVYEDKRGDDDMLQLARVTPAGEVRHSKPWPGTAPDIGVQNGRAVIAYGTKSGSGEEEGGAVQLRFGTSEAAQ